MKKLVILTLLMVTSLLGFSQSQRYYDLIREIESQGYTIVDQKQSNVTQGDYMYFYRGFSAGNKYMVVGLSEDLDVEDVDVYIYYEDGDLYIKDNDTSNAGVIIFTLKYDHKFKVVVKNYKSKTPNYGSTLRSIVAYK